MEPDRAWSHSKEYCLPGAQLVGGYIWGFRPNLRAPNRQTAREAKELRFFRGERSCVSTGFVESLQLTQPSAGTCLKWGLLSEGVQPHLHEVEGALELASHLERQSKCTFFPNFLGYVWQHWWTPQKGNDLIPVRPMSSAHGCTLGAKSSGGVVGSLELGVCKKTFRHFGLPKFRVLQ